MGPFVSKARSAVATRLMTVVAIVLIELWKHAADAATSAAAAAANVEDTAHRQRRQEFTG